MKKFLKVILIIALVLLCIFLLDLVLKLILDAPLRTCKKACEQLQQSDTHILYYENDKQKKREVKTIPVDWDSVGREFKVEKDQTANTITFYSWDWGGWFSCEGNRVIYSKHIFAFDSEGSLSVYCVIRYKHDLMDSYEPISKETYKVCCLDKENCTAIAVNPS